MRGEEWDLSGERGEGAPRGDTRTSSGVLDCAKGLLSTGGVEPETCRPGTMASGRSAKEALSRMGLARAASRDLMRLESKCAKKW